MVVNTLLSSQEPLYLQRRGSSPNGTQSELSNIPVAFVTPCRLLLHRGSKQACWAFAHVATAVCARFPTAESSINSEVSDPLRDVLPRWCKAISPLLSPFWRRVPWHEHAAATMVFRCAFAGKHNVKHVCVCVCVHGRCKGEWWWWWCVGGGRHNCRAGSNAISLVIVAWRCLSLLPRTGRVCSWVH